MKMLLISTVSAFFRQRAGTFLVLLGVLFGFLSAREHHAFALFFLTGSYGMFSLFVIWLVYSMLCAQFLINTWKLPEYTFIFHTRTWPAPVRMRRFAVQALGFLQPILYYGAYLLIIAIQDKLLARLWPVVPFYIVLMLMLAVTAEWRIRKPVLYVPVKSRSLFKWPFARPSSWLYWSMEWLVRERGITLLVGKLGAMLVAAGTMLYYSTGEYDIRMPAVGMSLAYLLNLGLSLELYQWEAEIWLWGRSLPVSVWKRWGRVVAAHLVLIVPETAVVLRSGALGFAEVEQLYLLGLTTLIVSHLYFYKRSGLPENAMQVFLFGFVGLTLLILYKIPLLLIACFGLLFSLSRIDNWVDALSRDWLGVPTGLILTGSIAGVVLACSIRFLTLAEGSLRAGLAKLPPNLDEAARSLGRTPIASAAAVLLPLMRPAILTAAVLVFVDTVKELSATILLRPFGFNTLATHVYENASRAMVQEGAAASLLIILVAMVPVVLLSGALMRDREAHV